MRRSLTLILCCAVAAASCSQAPPGEIDETRTIDVGGSSRQYRLVVPADIQGPIPVVLVFHGFAGTPDQIRDLSGFAELAHQEGFAVAFPAAAGIVPAWRTDVALSAPDVAFARAVIDDIDTVIDLDLDRVYAAGMSNGGGMAGRLACAASDVFAAVGVVAAAHGLGACGQERPVPVIGFHGDADRIVALDGIPFVVRGPGDWLADRARGNGCAPDPVESRIAADVERFDYVSCDAAVVFLLVEGGRHGWPGSDRAGSIGDSTGSIDATALMWEFFAESSMP
jgi:polyhydroxybutyrate depolymerase